MDALQTRMNKSIGRKNQIFGNFAMLSTRADNPSLFNFLDTTDTLGIIAGINWRHTLSPRLFGTLGYQYSRFSTRTTPFFENRENVSGAAGINGNNQDPMNWGPPSLTFSSGITPLTDAQAAFNRNQTSALSYSLFWYHTPHNVTFGVDYRRQQFNDLGQQNARGTFTFTGAATGSDFADFLLGVPDTSAIAFGNADKYFRDGMYDAYANDDWRVSPELTINWGLRWEYGSPVTEKYGRLVNLDVAPGFSAVAPVMATDPIGPLTGEKYPRSLMHPDRQRIEPRVAIAWRPISGSSMVVRAGYGVYYNTSVYQQIAVQMAQQSPLSKSLSVANSAADPLTLANGFNASPTITPDTFARRSEFPRGILAELAGVGAAGPARRAGDDGDVHGHQGNARHAGISAEHVSGGRGESVPGVPVGIRLSDFERKFDARGGRAAIAAAAAKRIRGAASVHVLEVD